MNASRGSLRALLSVLFCSSCTAAPPATDSQPTSTIRVLAYNIHHGEGMDEVTDLERIAAFIRDVDPDIVTLQEVDSVTERTGGVDQAAVLGERTGMHSAYGRFMSYQGGAYGMAVLSRWPIREATNWRLTDGEEPRSALGVRVRPAEDGEELLVVGIHFYRTEEERLAQAADLVEALASESVPVILAGDFNSLPGSAVMEFFGAGWSVLGKGEDHFTYPSYEPAREIDFILIRPDHRFEVLDHRALDEPVLSDHRPILAELALVPAGGDAR